jgi:hypothetical protein
MSLSFANIIAESCSPILTSVKANSKTHRCLSPKHFSYSLTCVVNHLAIFSACNGSIVKLHSNGRLIVDLSTQRDGRELS